MDLLRGALVSALLLTPAIADAATASGILSVSASVAVTCVLAIKGPAETRLGKIVLHRLKAIVDGTVRTVSVGCSRMMPRILISLERAGEPRPACADGPTSLTPACTPGRLDQEYVAVFNF